MRVGFAANGERGCNFWGNLVSHQQWQSGKIASSDVIPLYNGLCDLVRTDPEVMDCAELICRIIHDLCIYSSCRVASTVWERPYLVGIKELMWTM